ncbi:MAG: nucleoside triphosphate pyrophosphohydrolase [Bacteroidales bacterium]|jgi:XTP/dITP diphosphohydrolase|nr:nucleoside triphosphate pyrophosphohydrolase [Bacteroidales bacterium]MDD4394779.1 nucleoside triphosphate pyrophosphohydrolase [Bacteroidales bacterium]
MNDPRIVAFKRLLDIMDELRLKCPWDRKQTFESLRCLTIEETYELADAILEKQPDEICKELGDIMLHLVFYAKIAEEQSLFDITSVLNGICEKLIRRHPHIFADTHVDSVEDIKTNWEKIKLKEGNRSVLGGVPTALPAMIKAYRIQDKAHGIGFDWDNSTQVWDKVEEEIEEFRVESAQHSEHIDDEFGDLLFSLINYARFNHIHPEDALEKTNKRFISRFQFMEEKASEQGRNIADLSLEEMEVFWKQAKQFY